MIVLLLAQAAVGMVANLYVAVPAHHLGAHPASYLRGSVDSVAWAIRHGSPALAVHAALGVAVVVAAIVLALRALRSGRRAVTFWMVLGALLVIGAGFNGASFLDYDHDVSSLIMALLAFAALGCYAAAQRARLTAEPLPVER